MNQYLVYLLACSTAVDSAARQWAQFEALCARVPENESEAALAEVLASRD